MNLIRVICENEPNQGCNEGKVISEVQTSFELQCTVSMGGNVNTRQMSQPDMGSIFHMKKINNIFWSQETIMGTIKIIKI